MWKRISPLVLFVLLLSCSPNSDTKVLFQGEPGIQDLPTNVELQQIVGDVPQAKFATLKYENHIREKLSGKTKLTYTSRVNLKEQDKQIAVTKTEYFTIQPNGSVSKQVTDVDVGVPGIVSLVHLTTKQQPPQQIQLRKVVRRIDNVRGRLFPLDKGNQLSFNIVFAYQVTKGRTNNTAQELSWSYRFRILKHYDGSTLPNRTIQGKVYVIDIQEIEPEGIIDNRLIHFAESIGVVIKTVRQEDNFTEETRLVNMEE
jgi:hypothetical protein